MWRFVFPQIAFAAAADIAVADPVMVAGMPLQLTTDTGLDTPAHAVEGFICGWLFGQDIAR